ncbi:hypothetical protein L1049_004857 [Liquidambar formosana]|uniref:FAD-dependent oxidoreductase domain-containing protein 1 n=1 Tax=Liquidambar formosana TaxID=63359 RepID=A0AAP0X122_LIQFO
MAMILAFSPNPNPFSKPTSSIPSQRTQFLRGFALESSLFGSNFPEKSFSYSTKKTRRNRLGPLPYSALNPSSASHSFDVVIIGAGIIGLTIARQFLTGSDLSVAVVDKAVPCSGATGAGQGYIWMVHKTPESEKWELAMRSRKLWEMLAESIQDQGMNPLEVLGWKKTGSLLIGRTPNESAMLKKRVKQLSQAGLRAEYLSSSDLLLEEPALMVGDEGGAAFLPDDCQLDAHRTVAFIEKAGCWSGSLMDDLFRKSDIILDVPVKPRKGHLLVIENFNSFQLNRGLMEVGYVDHQFPNLCPTASAPGSVDHEQTLSVSMTATMDTVGNLLLGSSRQFAGFSTEVDDSIIHHIWKRAGEFFPTLRQLTSYRFQGEQKSESGITPFHA